MTSLTVSNNNGTSKLAAVEKALIQGDLAQLSEGERINYYQQVCESVGLNPLTKPFEYIKLNGKLTLYALKACTDQLRKINQISIDKPDIQFEDELIVVSVTARDKTGRTDSDLGVVVLGDLKGEAKANAIMKSLTKAKRRVTLSICGLGMLDESELDTIPQAQVGTAAFEPEAPRLISDAQGKRLWAIAKKTGYTQDGVRKLLEVYGLDSFKNITTAQYESICEDAADAEKANLYNEVAGGFVDAEVIEQQGTDF